MKQPSYLLPGDFRSLPVTRISPMRDERMRKAYGKPSDFLRLRGEASVREMMIWGADFVDQGHSSLLTVPLKS